MKLPGAVLSAFGAKTEDMGIGVSLELTNSE